jgi:hypothetical protein
MISAKMLTKRYMGDMGAEVHEWHRSRGAWVTRGQRCMGDMGVEVHGQKGGRCTWVTWGQRCMSDIGAEVHGWLGAEVHGWHGGTASLLLNASPFTDYGESTRIQLCWVIPNNKANFSLPRIHVKNKDAGSIITYSCSFCYLMRLKLVHSYWVCLNNCSHSWHCFPILAWQEHEGACSK